MPELPAHASGGLKIPVIPGTQIRTAEKPTTPPTRVPVPEVKSEAIKAVIAAVDEEIAAISNEPKTIEREEKPRPNYSLAFERKRS